MAKKVVKLPSEVDRGDEPLKPENEIISGPPINLEGRGSDIETQGADLVGALYEAGLLAPKPGHEIPKTIAELQAEELELLQKIRQSQIDAAASNAISHYSGNESPVKQARPAQNKCPDCANNFLTVYQSLKMCNVCGWRSDRPRVIEPVV